MLKVQQGNLENEVMRLNSEGYTIDSADKKDDFYEIKYRKSGEKPVNKVENPKVEEVKIIAKRHFSFENIFGKKK